jgi:hypothetical protein
MIAAAWTELRVSRRTAAVSVRTSGERRAGSSPIRYTASMATASDETAPRLLFLTIWPDSNGRPVRK